MKNLLVMVILTVVFCVGVIAAPKMAIYRFEGKGFTDIPAGLILGTDVKFDPWVLDDSKWPAGKNIALLVHGFPMFSPGTSRNSLNSLALYFNQPRQVGNNILPAYNVIYAVEYYPNISIIDTAAELVDMVHDKTSNLAKDVEIDIFAHSMGGIVARTALEFPKKSMADRVSHLVTMGTPHGGIILAEYEIFKQVFGELADVECLKTDFPSFMTILNNSIIPRPKVNCDYYSIIGTDPTKPELYAKNMKGPLGLLAEKFKEFQDIGMKVHDGLIYADSAELDLKPYCRSFKSIPLALNHDYVARHQLAFDVIDQWMIDDKWFAGVANTLAAPPNQITKYTGGVPIFLGKTQAEVRKIFGEKIPRITDRSDVSMPSHGKRLYWEYSYVFAPEPVKDPMGNTVNVKMDFSKYANEDENNVADGTRVHSVVYSKAVWQTMSASRFVPKEILAIKPTFIAYAGLNLIAVVWIIDGKTFCLAIQDSKKELFTTVEKEKDGYMVQEYYLNDNGRNFVSCDWVNEFICVDTVVDIFNKKKWEKTLFYYYNYDGMIEYPGGSIGIKKFKN